MYDKIRVVLVVLMAIVIGAIIIFYSNKYEVEEEPEVQSYEPIDIALEFNSGWLPYWDYDNAKLDWLSRQNQPSEIVSFAVVYEGKNLHVVEEMDAMTRELVEMDQNAEVYISFTNDVLQEDGSYLQKDKEFLENFMYDPEHRAVYIDDIIEMALEYQVDGIEIDYENIKADEELWGYFTLFVDELHEKSTEMGISLRVVLGYDSVKYASFPEGPKYIIMCYNLYGPHSGPGPKADKEFLELCYEINQELQPNVSMAFSNNGFTWDSKGRVTAVNKDEAIATAKLYEVEILRDVASSSLYYEYTDYMGETYQVWFADDTTLSDWMTWGKEAGYSDFSLWRYGE